MGNLKKIVNSRPEVKHNIMRRLRQMVITFILIGLFLFIPAGSLNWFYGWLYMLIYFIILLIGSLVLPLEVIAERGSKKMNVERWDKVLTRFLLFSSLGIFIVAGLDFRWHWSPKLTTGLHIRSMFIFILGCALDIWAMRTNRFFSTAVRLQFERGHKVCSSGPYRYVRHPGYLGMILYNLATPTFLGSLWAMIPTLMTVSLFVVRTWQEDKTLRRKLPGYAEYAARTRYRLLPWLW